MGRKQNKEQPWQLTVRGVAARGALALSMDKYTDVTFMVGEENEIIKAHRFMLCSASPVFEAMLLGSMAEKEDIRVADMTPDVFQAVLDYIYTDKFQGQNIEQILMIWYAAAKYFLESLVDECVALAIEKLDQKNVAKILNHAFLYDSEKLLNACWNFLSTEMKFENEFFKELHEETLLNLLDLNRITYGSEVDFFNGLNQWAEDECVRRGLDINHENLRKITKDMIKKIRFLTIEPELFAVTVERSKLLTYEEKFALMANVNDKMNVGRVAEMPAGFSTNLMQRTPSLFLPANCNQLIPIEDDSKLLYYVRKGTPTTLTITSDKLDIQLSIGFCVHNIHMKLEEVFEDKCKLLDHSVSEKTKYVMKANHIYRFTATALFDITCPKLHSAKQSFSIQHYDAQGNKAYSRIKFDFGSLHSFIRDIHVIPASYA